MSNFGKGITVASGFDLNAKAPLDTRLVVQDSEELQQHILNNRVYEGMIVYVIKEKITYQFINSEWVVFGGQNVSSNESTGVIIDNLNSLLINASLSANQGRILREMIEAIQSNFYTIEEVETIKTTLENKDLEILDKFNTISEYFPTKLSSFENDMNYLTEDNLEETLRYITIPVKTSQLENDAGYITQENLEENVVNKIPIKTSQLENDAGYVTEENINGFIDKIPIKTSQLENDANFITQNDLDETLADIEFIGGGGGNGSNIHINSNEPSIKNVVWIDTSTPSNLTVVNYDERIKLKYYEMLNGVKIKLNNLENKINLIETNINKTSGNNVSKITEFKTNLSILKNQINLLILQIESIQSSLLESSSDIKILKTSSRNVRKQAKTLIFSLIDFNDEVMRMLDSENIFDDSNNDDNDDNDDNDNNTQINNTSLLTEDGLLILTEDGLVLLVDGIESDNKETEDDVLLTETGLAILTESGLTLLIDKVETSETLADAILTEMGVAILTEQGKQILKG